jgi:translocation and assembly module TamB
MRWLRNGLATVALSLLFLAALVLGVALHLDLPRAKRALVARVNASLESSFQGRVQIEQARQVRSGRVVGARVRVLDPRGDEVLWVDGVDVQYDLLGLVRSALRRDGPIEIGIDELVIDHARVLLAPGPSGELTLAEAFAPQDPTGEGRASELRIESLRIRHAWVRGHLPELPTLDVDLAHVLASLSYDDDRFAVALDHADIVARGMPRRLDPVGRLEGALELRAGQVDGRLNLAGRVGQLPVDLFASIAGDHLRAVLNVPRVQPESVRAHAPELPLRAAASLQAEVSGKLPLLRARVLLGLGSGWLHVRASGRAGAQPSAQVEIDGRDLSPRAFSADAPDLRLSFDGRGSVRVRQEGRTHGALELKTRPTLLGETPLPAVSIEARGSDRRIDAQVVVHEPGAPIEVDAVFEPSRAGGRLELDARTEARDLAKVERLGVDARGKLLMRARGLVQLAERPGDSPRVEATISGSALGLALGPIQARAARLSSTLVGPVSELELELGAQLSHVRAFGRHATALGLRARGPLFSPHAELSLAGPELPTVRGRARLSLAGAPSARAIELSLERQGVRAQLGARRVTIAGARVRIDGFQLSGPGELSASADASPAAVSIAAQAERLELGQLARLLAIPALRSGEASFALQLSATSRRRSGHLSATLAGVRVGSLEPISGSGELELDGRTLRGSLDAKQGDTVELSAVSPGLRLPRGALTPASLRELRGELALSANADLGRLVRMLPPDTLPLSSVRGRARLDARLERSDGDRRLEAQLGLRTRGLRIQGRGSGGEIRTRHEALRVVPWQLAGVDVAIDARLRNDGAPSELSVRAYDARGTLLRAQVGAELPLAALLDPSREVLLAAMLETPLELSVSVPERAIESLPELVRPPMTGKLAAGLRARGTLARPELMIRLDARRLRPKSDPDLEPFELAAGLEYADGRGRLEASLDERRREVLALESRFSGRLHELVRGADPELRASAVLRARNFRLESIPLLADRQLRGRVVGDVTLRGLGYDPKLDARLAILGLAVGPSQAPSARIELHAEHGRLDSKLEVRQRDGYLEGNVAAGLEWQKRIVPKLSEQAPLVARARAKSFRAGLLHALVDRSVSKLDGRIDGDVRLRLAPGRSTLDGRIAVREGVVQVPAIGQEFRDIRADLVLRPDGVIELRRASARGLTGRVHAAAAARLDGLSLAALRARVKIGEHEKIPLTIEGVSLGNAWGVLEIEARARPKQLRVEVDVRSFQLELPRLGQRELQSLEDAERIRIGVRRPGGFIPLPLQPLEEEAPADPTDVRISVKLGNDVWIRQGTALRVKLAGAVTVRLQDEPRINGQIRLDRGRIDVQGKLFEISEGTLTFQGESPPNPVVVARARWESPDGIVVFADFTGPVDSGELRLHSEPALTDDQILSLLLFGGTDGMFGTGSGGEGGKAATAAGVGGGVAAQGVNAALDRLTDLDVTTRIDTSGQQPRPELAVQLTRRLSAALGYNLGEPSPGKAPDRTLLMLDFRVSRRWALSSTFGDRGSSLLELVWRYRY